MRKLIFISLLIFLVSTVLAQPTYDNPCGAIPVTIGSSCTYGEYTTAGATYTAVPPITGCTGWGTSCAPSMLSDIWLTFTIPNSYPVYIATASVVGGMDNPSFEIYTGNVCAGAGTYYGCQTDELVYNSPGPFPDYVLSGLPAGTQVYLRLFNQFVDSACTVSSTGAVNVCVASSMCNNVPIPGQTCAGATPICTFAGYCGTTRGYTRDTWSELTTAFAGTTPFMMATIENNSFLKFVASASTVSFTMNVFNCSQGNGVQTFAFFTNSCGSGPLGIVSSTVWRTPGTYNISLTNLTIGNTYYYMIDGISGDICDYSITNINGVSLLPQANPDINLCTHDSTVTLTVNGGVAPYMWTDIQGNIVATGNQLSVLADTSQTYIVTASGGGNALCSATLSDTVHIRVVPNTFMVSANPNNPSICFGDSLTLHGYGAESYVWAPPLWLSATSGDTVIAYPSTSKAYRLIGFMYGCPDTSDIYITVHHPTASIVSNAPVCEGESFFLATAPCSCAYAWNGPNGFSSSSYLVSFANATPADTGAYSLVVIEDGCPSDTQSVTVSLKPTPPEPVFTIPTLLCEGDTLSLSAPDSSGYIYHWSGVGGWTSSQQHMELFPVTTAMSGTYSLYVVEEGCTSQVHSETVSVHLVPHASFDVQEECFQTVAFFSSSMALEGNMTSYMWYFGDDSTSTETSPIHSYIASGMYAVTLNVTTDVGCSTSVTIPIEVHPSPHLADWHIPNIITPNGDGINDALTFVEDTQGCVDYVMHIFNRWGVLVYEQRAGSAPFQGLTIEGHKLNPGVYFYTITVVGAERNGTITIAY